MIYTDNRQEKLNVDEEFINSLEAVCDFVLKKEGVNCKYQISLLFVDNEEIREINRETRNIDRATDVLSFPMLDYPNKKFFKDVLSLERALEQSEEYNHSYKREVSYLVVHSILHLLGYDHMEEDDKAIMRKREEELLGELKISR